MALTEAIKRNCDLCRAFFQATRPATVDGKTQYGYWAYMCDACFQLHGSPWPKPTQLDPTKS